MLFAKKLLTSAQFHWFFASLSEAGGFIDGGKTTGLGLPKTHNLLLQVNFKLLTHFVQK